MKEPSIAIAGTIFIPTRTIGRAQIQPPTNRSRAGNFGWIGRVISGVALAGLSFSLLASGKAEAFSFDFTNIADTNTPVPGGTVNFFSFDSLPAIDNGSVAFEAFSLLPDEGFGPSLNEGIYTSIGGSLKVVADTNTPVPGDTENFEFFSNPSLDNKNVAFTGVNSGEGIYKDVGGKLNVVADTNTPIPGGTGNFPFLDFERPSLNNGNVAFTSFNSGLYTDIGGKLNVVADTNTPIPGSIGNFAGFDFPSLDNGNVAFEGLERIAANVDRSLGIYKAVGGKLDVVADRNTPVPGGTGNFTEFGEPTLDNEQVAFVGVDAASQSGIYTSISGLLEVVADTSTPVPGSTGNFSDFDFRRITSLDNGNVAFVGVDAASQSGIYTDIGGALVKVVAQGDLLDGKKVSSLNFGTEGLSGNQIAFNAVFDDGSQGTYVATAVPEPITILGSGMALGFGALMKRQYLRKRKKI